MTILRANNLKKVYTTRFGAHHVQALANVSFSVEQGEYVAIMGESGSGKTTLLNILAALDKPTSGKVLLDGKDITAIKEGDLAAFRRDRLGFVFQDFNLLDTFSLQDNIFLPLVLQGKSYEEMSGRIAPLARKLGISHLLNKYPYEVSGGEQQRAAVARALITNPRLILADEPTGALDSKTAASIFDLFRQIADSGRTVVIVTHDLQLAARCDRQIVMFRHFFHALCCAARCNLQIAARGENDHHKAEAIFKAFARALRMAVARQGFGYDIPSSKGVL